jgi:hypothetical protein
MSSQNFMLKAAGLQTNYQSLMELSPGALLQATNTVINKEGVIEPRRGINTFAPLYSSFFGGSAITAKQLFDYKGQILAHTSDDNIAYYDSSVNRYSYVNGATKITEPVTGSRIRAVESKGNLLLTNSTGVKKISAKDSFDITNAAGPIIVDAGVPMAISPMAAVSASTTVASPSFWFLRASGAGAINKVAYRVLFIKTDNNDNLLFGAPSSRTIVTNAITTLDYVVDLTIALPKNIYLSSEKYKVRIYRSESVMQASGSLTEPSDELYQVYESDIGTSAANFTVRDVVTENGRLAGVPLYTNQNSGEGILKSNNTPPSAKDIALFKGHMFYANTKTKDSISFTLADINRLNAGTNIILADGTDEGTETYGLGFQERSRHTIAITQGAAAFFYNGFSVYLSSANDERRYAFWFDETSGAARTAPVTPIPTGYIAVKIPVFGFTTVTQIATALSNAIAASPDFTVVNNYQTSIATFNVVNVASGASSAPFWDGSNGVTFYPTSSKITVASAAMASYSGFHIQLGTRIANAQKRYAFWFDGTVGQTVPVPTNIPSGFILVKVNVYNAVPTIATIATAINNAINGTGEFTTIYQAGTAVILVVPIGGTLNPDTVTTNLVGLMTYDVTTLGRGDTANLVTMQTTTLLVNSAIPSEYQTIDFFKYCYLEFFGPISTDTTSNNKKYVIWFDTTGFDATPTIFDATLIKVTINGLGTTAAIAAAISTALQANTNFQFANASRTFTVHYTATTNTIQIITHSTNTGYCANTTLAASVGTFGIGGLPQISISTTFLPVISSQVANNSLFARISTSASTSTAIEETVRSLVQSINNNQNSKYIATYLSNFGDVPGKFMIEKRDFDELRFIVATTQPSAASAFSPALGVAYPLSAISSTTGGANIITSYNQGVGWTLGSQLSSTFLFGIRRLPNDFASFGALPTIGDVSKLYRIPAFPSGFLLYNWTGSAYSLASNDNSTLNGETTVSVAGEFFTNQKYFTVNKAYNEEIQYSGFAVYLNDFRGISLFKSKTEAIGNRLYYSKYQEHEAVPILNYIDIGSRDKQIQRIIPLRSSLFILKDDGIYRLAGDPGSNPTWDVAATDNTCVIRAPDTAVTLNNQCYFFSTKGFIELNESSQDSISRPIDDKLLRYLTTNLNIDVVSFCATYESEKSLLFWTVGSNSDDRTKKAYRYNTVTKAWTEWDASHTCAIVSSTDDKMYFGSAIDNYIEVERKNFDRFDYVDRTLRSKISTNRLYGNIVKPTNLDNIEVGDVLQQTQYLTIYQYNALLKKLDLDPGLSQHDFYDELKMIQGNTMSIKLQNLAIKLSVVDASVNYTALLSGLNDFPNLQISFNAIITALSNTSTNTRFINYQRSEGTISYEAIVLGKSNISKEVTLNLSPPFIAGDAETTVDTNNLTIYKGIDVSIEYAPIHAGDPSTEKQFSYGTFMFERRNFRSAEVAYNSDVSDSYDSITINPTSSGIFGGAGWGDGSVWGGLGDQAELVTYIPMRKQRARFIGCKFIHTTALESFSLYGVSLTYRTYTTPNRTNR